MQDYGGFQTQGTFRFYAWQRQDKMYSLFVSLAEDPREIIIIDVLHSFIHASVSLIFFRHHCVVLQGGDL